jgi:hypothetical protein
MDYLVKIKSKIDFTPARHTTMRFTHCTSAARICHDSRLALTTYRENQYHQQLACNRFLLYIARQCFLI